MERTFIRQGTSYCSPPGLIGILFKFKDNYKQPFKYRIGFYLAKDEGKNAWYYPAYHKKVKSFIVWSKTLIWADK